MRCHYMSDLHLESQDFRWRLPQGDVLILAGDLAHASCLDPARSDPYAVRQRDRVLRFIDAAVANFVHVLLIAGNHDHYDGVLEDTVPSLRKHLPGVTILDNDAVEIGGTSFFGTTLWSDFEGRSETAMERARRGAGEFFFVKRRVPGDGTGARLEKFRPQHALAEHERSVAALRAHMTAAGSRRAVVVSHHAPSRKGLNPLYMGNGLDGAYASDLDGLIAALGNVAVWVHGHTHVRRTYSIAGTTLVANCRGFDGGSAGARAFTPTAAFEI